MKPGDRLGDRDRFEIEQRIGAGGMGLIFRGRDRTTGEPVAIKVISDGGTQRAARFDREVELLSELSHPGIVRYLAHGETAGHARYLAMEWLEGEDLKARLARAPLTVSESVRLATRVAEALGAAHARGIVHRDLKPSNLFLPGGSVEQAKILDFGIAQREGSTQLTRTGVLLGTPGYMAPEQARGASSEKGGELDARADVFALGCVLFRCVTGTPAFDGDSVASILSAILFGETPRVSEWWPEVPPQPGRAGHPDAREGAGAAAERRDQPGRGARDDRAPGARRDPGADRAPGARESHHLEHRQRAAVPVRRAARAHRRRRGHGRRHDRGRRRRGVAAGERVVRRLPRAARRRFHHRRDRAGSTGGDGPGRAGRALRARAAGARGGAGRSPSRWGAPRRAGGCRMAT